MTPQERIEFIVNNCEGGSLKRFSQKADIEYSVACRLRKGVLGNGDKEGLGRFAERIYRAYPELSAAWLLTGEGEPFSSPRRAPAKSYLQRLERLEKIVDGLLKSGDCANLCN